MGESEFIMGFLLAFGGGTLANLGMNIQKLSHKRDDAKPPSSRTMYAKRPLWLFGFLLFFGGQLSLLGSLAFADQATCSVLGTLALVSNAVFARLLFGELFTRLDAISMSAIIGGSVLVIVFFKHADQNFTIPELEQHLSGDAFLVCLALLVVWLLCLLRRWRQGRATALVYSWLAAAIGALSLTFGKVTMQLVKLSAGGENQFCCFWTFLVPLLFAVAALSNVHFLNEGLANCEAMVLVPMYYNLNNIIATALGIVTFADYSTFREPLPAAMFFAGVGLMGVGVAVLAKKPAPPERGLPALRDESGGVGPSEDQQLSPPKGGVVRQAELEGRLGGLDGRAGGRAGGKLDKIGGTVARGADRLASGVVKAVRRGSDLASKKRSSGYTTELAYAGKFSIGIDEESEDDDDDDDDDDEVEVCLELHAAMSAANGAVV